MVHFKHVLLVTALVAPCMTLVLPVPAHEANLVPREGQSEAEATDKPVYGGVFLNNYQESTEKSKRGSRAESGGQATYEGVFLNRYEESAGKGKREAEAEVASQTTYGGVFLNRYEESAGKE